MPLIDPQSTAEFAEFGMTVDRAIEVLKKPLVFGDPVQIKAVAIMEEVRKAEQALLKCDHDYESRKKLCPCLSSFQPGIVRGALSQLKNRELGRWGQEKAADIERCL